MRKHNLRKGTGQLVTSSHCNQKTTPQASPKNDITAGDHFFICSLLLGFVYYEEGNGQ